MIPFDRLLMVQAASVAAAMLAAVAGGLLAKSWLWAVACAVLVYAACSVGVMAWMARRLRSSRSWLEMPGDLAEEVDEDWSGE